MACRSLWLIHTYFCLSSVMILAAEPPTTPTSASAECMSILKGLPKKTLRGTVTVPEDWEAPVGSSPEIEVAYYYRKASENPQQAPWIAFFNGGPASSSLSSQQIFAANALARKANWVFIDQRGTGCSTAIDAGEAFDNAKLYGPKAIVRDAEAIRTALLGEDRPWRIFGQSFGGTIVSRYLMMRPEGIEAAYVHGFSLADDVTAWTAQRLQGQTRVLEEYFKVYPEDRALLTGLKNRIPPDYCFQSSPAAALKVCGPGIIDALFIRLGFRDSWSKMHKEIGLLNLSGIFLKGAVASNILPQIEAELTLPRILLGQLVAGSDLRVICRQAEAKLAAEGVAGPLLLSDCNLLKAVSTVWDDGLTDYQDEEGLSIADFTAGLAEAKSWLSPPRPIPFHVYSGGLDSFSPQESFGPYVDASKGNISYRHFPSSGHEGFYAEEAILMAVTKP